MKLVNISQAKTHLSSLIEAAEQGEEVMILRGSRPAVTLLKVTEADLHFNPEISMKGLEEFDSEGKGVRSCSLTSSTGRQNVSD